jgi:hypothetical protein
MKVTALIPDQLVSQVQKLALGKNITDSLTIALKDWVSSKKVSLLNSKILRKPLSFSKGFTAEKVRRVNRAA